MGLKFINSTQSQAGQLIGHRLNDYLSSDKKVVWLVSGGSNIAISADILASLADFKDGNLRVLLTDERYGKFGHPDSNAVQLEQAGFNPPAKVFGGVLTRSNLSLKDTVESYATQVSETFAWADCIVGQFGVGPDGHTAGILPESPASRDQSELVCGYSANDFLRITMTAKAIEMVSVAYVCAFGKSKRDTLIKLRDHSLPIADQPAQIFKLLPEAYIINDVLGDS